MQHDGQQPDGHEARGAPEADVDGHALHGDGLDGQAHGPQMQAAVSFGRQQEPGRGHAVDAFQQGEVAQFAGTARGVEHGAGQLQIGLVQGVEGHDLHGQDGGGELRAPEDAHQGRALGHAEAGEVGGHGIDQGGEAVDQAAHELEVALPPGDGELAHDQRRHGRDEHQTGQTDFVAQGEIALFGAAVEPLQQPAFRGGHEEDEQGLDEERMAVGEELVTVGLVAVGTQAQAEGGVRAAVAALPVAPGDDPVAQGRDAQHGVLLAEKAEDVQPVQQEQADEQEHGRERDHGAHHLGLHGGAHGIVHGAEHAAPPGQKGPDGGQRGQPQGHVGHEPVADEGHLHGAGDEQADDGDEQAEPHVEADETRFGLAPGQGIVEAGGRAHVQEHEQLLEKVGGKTVIAVHGRAQGTGQDGFHGQIDRHGSHVGQQLAYIATRQAWRGGGSRPVFHAGKPSPLCGVPQAGNGARCALRTGCLPGTSVYGLRLFAYEKTLSARTNSAPEDAAQPLRERPPYRRSRPALNATMRRAAAPLPP